MTSYNGIWKNASLKGKKRQSTSAEQIEVGLNECLLPSMAYTSLLPLSREKFKDIQALKEFCGPQAIKYLSNLPTL